MPTKAKAAKPQSVPVYSVTEADLRAIFRKWIDDAQDADPVEYARHEAKLRARAPSRRAAAYAAAVIAYHEEMYPTKKAA